MKVIEKIINGVPVTYIKTNKFKSIAGRLHFKSLVDKERVTKRMLLKDIMIYNCKKYNTNQKLNMNCLENYDANYLASVYQDGNYITNAYTFHYINDKFIDDDITDKVVDTFCEIVFNPNISNNRFNKKTFEICYKRLEEEIKRKKEDPDEYCFYKINNIMGKNKPYAFDSDLKVLKKQSTKTMCEEYNDLINNSEVSLYLIGDFDYEKVADKITKYIKTNIKLNDEILVNNDYSNELKKGECSLNTAASVLTLGFKCKDLTDFERVYVMPIYSNILGGTSTSRCFTEIREKNSLAYYAYTSYKKLYGLLYIYAGIRKDKMNKTLKLMIKMQESMKRVTEKEIDIAKKEIITSFKRMSDSYLKLLSMHYFTNITGEDSVDKKIEMYNSVTVKDVEKVHKKIIKDAYFFVRGDSNEKD